MGKTERVNNPDALDGQPCLPKTMASPFCQYPFIGIVTKADFLRRFFMHVKTVKRYYCEHCKKSGGSSYHMRIHEAHCTLNPNRKCRMCVKSGGYDGYPVSELVEILGDGCNDSFQKLWDHVDGCPACILAAIRQSPNIIKHGEIDPFDFEKYRKLYQFDFKGSCKSFWGDINDNERYY